MPVWEGTMTESELLLYGGIWTVCAVGAWFIATTKKAPDSGQWAIWGFLLGPFGLFAAIAFAKPTTDAPVSGRLCGKCGKPLSPVWTTKCNHCGAAFSEYPPVVPVHP